jgi:hypothetical protein
LASGGLALVLLCGVDEKTERNNMSAAYKGIVLFNEFDEGDFASWREMVLGYFPDKEKETYELLTALLEQSALEAEIRNVSGNDSNAEAKARAAYAETDVKAKGNLLRFLSPLQRRNAQPFGTGLGRRMPQSARTERCV